MLSMFLKLFLWVNNIWVQTNLHKIMLKKKTDKLIKELPVLLKIA